MIQIQLLEIKEKEKLLGTLLINMSQPQDLDGLLLGNSRSVGKNWIWILFRGKWTVPNPPPDPTGRGGIVPVSVSGITADASVDKKEYL